MPIRNVTRSFFLLFTLSVTLPVFAAELIPWNSAEGIKRLNDANAKTDFYALANHFESQENKVFCGLASSAIVLNALRLDNPNVKKPEDHSLLSKEERRYFPKDFNPIFERYTQQNVLTKKAKSKMEILGKPITLQEKTLSDYGLQLRQLAALLTAHGVEVEIRVANNELTDDAIREELISNMETAHDYVLVNYSRQALKQKGSGHISPLAAYDQASDSFLIMDVNPNANKWLWVEARDLIAAMRTFDTTENRGYLLVREASSQAAK